MYLIVHNLNQKMKLQMKNKLENGVDSTNENTQIGDQPHETNEVKQISESVGDQPHETNEEKKWE